MSAAIDDAPRVVTIPYSPRAHFRALHNSSARWIFVVAHRRAGKTVALVNHLIRAALLNKRSSPPPRYGYIGPSFAQTKDLAWGYLKHYTSTIPGMVYSESELTALFPNGAKITLYGGSSAYERMRGLYFDGVVLDEYALLNADVWDSVVRPCLADYKGFGIMSGTANGDDHFKARREYAIAAPDTWDYFDIKVNETDALDPDEVQEMRESMDPAKFDREMMNSFDAPVEGAYYGELMAKIAEENRICGVPHDPRSQVYTAWDLGLRDFNVIWFFQRVGRELHAIDHLQMAGKGLEYYAQELKSGHRAAYDYNTHILPHDVMVRELGTGRTRLEIARELGLDVTVAPKIDPDDGIQAVRTVLPLCYFDAARTANGISALKSYRQGRNGKPLHDWASHSADAMRYFATSLDLVLGWSGTNVVNLRGPIRRRIPGIY